MEAQHINSTIKLVDSSEEQDRLEQLLEGNKPPYPPECAGLHYLLFTPFRYRPHKRGSRFRRDNQIQGVFYASEHPHTALAEKAYYSLLFYAESPNTPLPDNPVPHTLFSVRYKANKAVDLTEPPLNADERLWKDAADYTACQHLADEARKATIDLIKSFSARCPNNGKNISLLSCAAFGAKEPQQVQTWYIAVQPEEVVTIKEFPREKLTFFSADFFPKLGLKNPTQN
ncbi:MAG: RES family NAD+ phosphorylase [Nitrospirales bacterium]